MIFAYFTSTELLLDKNQNDKLLFWVKNDKKYPLLALLAKDILLIPASSTSIERIFQLLVTLQAVDGTD